MDLEKCKFQTENFMETYLEYFSDMPVKIRYMAGTDHDAYCITYNNYILRKPEIHIHYEMVNDSQDLLTYLLHELIHIRTAEFDIILNSLSNEMKSVYQNIVERCVASITDSIIKLIPGTVKPFTSYQSVDKESDSLE